MSESDSNSPSGELRRQLGNSDLRVHPVGFGCWPIAGISSLGVNDSDSLATIEAALASGINLIDTAFSYGYDGEADRLLARVIRGRRQEVVLCSKVGQYFDSARQRVVDGRPSTLLEHAQLVLDRLQVDHVDVMYLHLPDPKVPLEESATAIAQILEHGWAHCAGVSNVDLDQLQTFHGICPVTVVQPPFNMLQPAAANETFGFCCQAGIAVVCYWALMKGLLAGKLSRDHDFDPRDKRLTYPVFQGEAWERSQNLLDHLRELSSDLGCTVAQLVIAWTIRQPGITAALCGAKRPQQIEETAAAAQVELTPGDLDCIDRWIVEAQGENGQ